VTGLVEELTSLNREKGVYPICVNIAGFCLLFQRSGTPHFTAVIPCIHQQENRIQATVFPLQPNKKTQNKTKQKEIK